MIFQILPNQLGGFTIRKKSNAHGNTTLEHHHELITVTYAEVAKVPISHVGQKADSYTKQI